MRLEWVSLSGFRSYRELNWRPELGINVLVGPNGSGKTNLVEGIAYLGRLASIRGMPDQELIRAGENSAVLRGSFFSTRPGVASTRLIEIELPRVGRRRLQFNHKPARGYTLQQQVAVVSFIPEDMDTIKRGPALRRRMLDEAGEVLWPEAKGIRGEFEKVLRQRNAHLRRFQPDPRTLSVWNQRFVQATGQLMVMRSRTATVLAPLVECYYGRIAGDDQPVPIRYRSGWIEGLDPEQNPGHYEAKMTLALEKSEAADQDLGSTTQGPHRDEPAWLIGEREARHQASQGEQRSLALALCLGLCQAIEEQIGETPLLALDDAFSEIDPQRAQRLAACIPDGQVFITTAHPEEVPAVGRRWEPGVSGWR